MATTKSTRLSAAAAKQAEYDRVIAEERAHAAKHGVGGHRTKATIVDAPQHEETQFDFNAMMAQLPSWQRITCAWIASTIVGAGVSYLGTIAVAYLMAAAIVLTGSMFITSVIYVLGMLLVILASFSAGVGVHVEIITEKLDARYESAKSFVTSLFNSKKVCAS
jgi:hypothetical protein